MNKQLLLKGLILLVVVRILAPVISRATLEVTAIELSAQANVTATGAEVNRARMELEEQILKSTVRIVIRTWVVSPDEKGYLMDNTLGHATLMGDRFLVTHNHFNVPLSIRGDSEAYGQVFLFNAAGEKVFQGPLSDFVLVQEDLETLVFAYKEGGLFETLGFAPAAFIDGTSIALEAGMEVAQVDWDGAVTRIDWTSIKEVILEDGVPRLVLADGAMPGASGGGIFHNGSHVANNWRLEERLESSGEVVSAVTTVALNSAQIISS
jgi:hypothetical protein